MTILKTTTRFEQINTKLINVRRYGETRIFKNLRIIKVDIRDSKGNVKD
jgi:hypothetical protein